ncbi:unnamed protein product [Phytomonas sp. Hart1]|nr:unnamed protein product [Phytomonas sp. Hart1]|eukprot:CCW67574.1 unnamed protein product [Phytomonas sp. isolate Hart1]
MHKARVRTESMVQRFAKKPISEGFDLWDRGYLFGALRLFMFKAESGPPFQLAPCIDAIAELSLQLGAADEAQEQFLLATDKYRILQQPGLAELMRVRLDELLAGTSVALSHLEAYLNEQDLTQGGKGGDLKTRAALARACAYLAELYLANADDDDDDEGKRSKDAEVAKRAVEFASLAVSLGWDRVHLGYFTLGKAYEMLEELEKARDAYLQAIKHCPIFLNGLEYLIDVLRKLEVPSKELLPYMDQAIDAHPRAHLLREKAFILSEVEGDDAALAYLETLIASPPLEEMECVSSDNSGPTVATLLKAKAAILADGGRFPEALAAAEEAVKACTKDKEAEMIVADIKEAMKG